MQSIKNANIELKQKYEFYLPVNLGDIVYIKKFPGKPFENHWIDWQTPSWIGLLWSGFGWYVRLAHWDTLKYVLM